MTFRVIEGGGRAATPAPGSVEEARAQIIDRVAAAIWAFQDEHPDSVYATWAEMKRLASMDPARSSKVRVTLAQARAAVAAMTVGSPPEAEYLILTQFLDNGDAPAAAMAVIDDFVAGVLK
nr:hypothetical protein [Brevundimonas naejangsanensis]